MPTIASADDLRNLRTLTANAARNTFVGLRALMNQCEAEPQNLLKKLKFEQLGRDPFNPDSLENLTEQINQQASAIAALDAVELLMEWHENETWSCDSGAGNAGHDISNAGGSIIAEVFAAVDPKNNRKLSKDYGKLLGNPMAQTKYLFYRSPMNGAQATRVCSQGITMYPLPY